MKDFEKIYSEYFDTVYQYVKSLCLDESWAEEITQDSFFKALKSIDNFRGDCKLSVWLCQIAKNEYLTSAKVKNRQCDYPLEIIPETIDFEQKIYDKETAIELHKILHSLDEPYKEVFWMRTFGELSFSEIGKIMDKSENWARVTYYRAKVKIKEALK